MGASVPARSRCRVVDQLSNGGIAMDVVTQGPTTVVDVHAASGVSWSSIAAGAVAAVAVTLILVALGAGLGLSSISPWADSGVSATTFTIGTGIYFCCVAVMSSAVGGYLAARMRTRWVGLHTSEVFFRDTAHGFIAWAFATLLTATVVSGAVGHIAGTAASAVGGAASQAAQAVSPADLSVDKLLRPAAPAPAAAPAPGGAAAAAPAQPGGDNARAELLRLWTSGLRNGGEISAPDRTYVASVIARNTGLSQADAERRVNEVITEAKAAADKARHGAAVFSFWLAASLLLGAFAASLAAVEGGQLRDGSWNERVITPRAI
jgi:hypothetical protein